jgi:hypothetical protein
MEKEVFDRMLVEFDELNTKTNKIRTFILDKEKFEVLDMINRDLLIAQLKAMETYLSVLSIRLGLNGSAENSNKVEIPIEQSEDSPEGEEVADA